MRAQYFTAFAVAGAASLAAVPMVRLVAQRTGFVDRPSVGKFHAKVTPYLGGVAIVAATLVAVFGMVAGSSTVNPSRSFLVLIGAGVLVALLGLVDDSTPLPANSRFAVQFGLAVVAAWPGHARFELTGIALADIAFTVVWIVGITNAVNIIDNMDGLSGGLAATSSLGLALVGAAAGLPMVALTAAALTGAVVGYLAYNIRPALLFMGDSGTLYLGFMIGVLTARTGGALTAATDGRGAGIALGLTTAVLLVSVPFVNTVAVTITRKLHGVPVSQGHSDHLSLRLLTLGLDHNQAVLVLVTVNVIGAACATALARGTVSWPIALLAGAVAVLVVGVPAWRMEGYPDLIAKAEADAEADVIAAATTGPTTGPTPDPTANEPATDGPAGAGRSTDLTPEPTTDPVSTDPVSLR